MTPKATAHVASDAEARIGRTRADVEQPSVTCIIGAYNHARFVVEALDAAFAQTYPDVRVIVFDDASSDATPEIIRSYLDERGRGDVPFVAHKRNRGLCATLNEVVAMVDTDYVAFISADDIQAADRIEQQVRLMEEAGPDYGFCYSNMLRIDADSVVTDEDYFALHGIHHPKSGDIFAAMAEHMIISTASALIRVSTLRDAGPYDESLEAEDYDMFLRLSRISRVAYHPGTLVSYRVLDDSLWHTLSEREDPLLRIHRAALVKHLGASAETDAIIARRVSGITKKLYLLGDPPDTTRRFLRMTAAIEQRRSTRVYQALASAGIPGRRVRPVVESARRVKQRIRG